MAQIHAQITYSDIIHSTPRQSGSVPTVHSNGSEAPIPPEATAFQDSADPAMEAGSAPNATPSGSIRRNLPVTIGDWPEPEDGPPESDDKSSNNAGDQSNEYACVDDKDDNSEAALQFAQISDEQFRDLLIRELGNAYDKEWQDLCEYPL